MKLAAGFQARAGFEDSAEIFIGRAGVGGGFEDDENAFAQMRGNTAAGVEDVGDVGLAILVEGRGDANDDGINFLDTGKVNGGGEAAGRDLLLDGRGFNVLDVGIAGIAGGDLFIIDVEPEDLGAGAGELQAERKPDVTQADDGNVHKNGITDESIRWGVGPGRFHLRDGGAVKSEIRNG